MKQIRRTEFEELIGTPIFARSFAHVMKFPKNFDAGKQRLRLDGWAEHDRLDGAFVNGPFIAWHKHDCWYLARRYKTTYIDHRGDRSLSQRLFGQPPTASFVLPATLIVPLYGSMSGAYGNDRCVRVFPPPDEAPHLIRIHKEQVELRVCRAEFAGRAQLYAEANFGAARHTTHGQPRRASYIGDHRLAPMSCSSDVLAAIALMKLPRFITRAGYSPNPAAVRTDLLPLGRFDVLPGHGSLCAVMKWPSAPERVLLAFEATHHARVAQKTSAQDVLDEVDESLMAGRFITWVAVRSA